MLGYFRSSPTRRIVLTLTIILQIVAFSGLTMPRSAQAATTTIIVNTNSDDSICTKLISLRCAIAMANANKSNFTLIAFSISALKIAINTPLEIDNAIQPIVIHGYDGEDGPITIDGGGKTRIFTVKAHADVLLSALSIDNGSASMGGAVENEGVLTITNSTFTGNSAGGANAELGGRGGAVFNNGTLTITNSRIYDNSAGEGGGIFNNTGNLTINDDVFYTNSAGNGGFGGGAIYNESGTLQVNRSSFTDNIASPGWTGGAVLNFFGYITISQSSFWGNTASGGGGVDNEGTLTIIQSDFSHNSAGLGSGGGLLNEGTLTIYGSTFSGNTADSNYAIGGGGGVANAGMLTVFESTFFANSVKRGTGGGIYNDESAVLHIYESTLSGNSAGDGSVNGGGIDNSGTVVMLSTIVARNTLSGTGSGPDIKGKIYSLGYNLVADGTSASGFITTDQVGTAVLPIDPQLGLFDNYGGYTPTLSLLNGSPAIGKGLCVGQPLSPLVPNENLDQRGFRRKSPCDVGAYETNPPQMTDTPNVTPANTVTATPTKIMGYHDAAGIPFVPPIS